MTIHPPASHPVAIIGAGPIGIELAVALKIAGAETLHFDAHQISHALTGWPRQTEFFSTTEHIQHHLSSQWSRVGTIAARQYTLPLKEDIQEN